MQTDKPTYLRRRKPGDIGQLRRVLWGSLLEIEDLLSSDDPTIKIKAAHALATLSGCYLKALDVGDLAVRLDRVEAAMGGTIHDIHRRQA